MKLYEARFSGPEGVFPMSKTAFLMSGQGSQYPGMGQELAQCSPAAAEIFAKLDALRPGTSAQCFGGTDEELKETKNTQPCMFAVELAAAAALEGGCGRTWPLDSPWGRLEP